MIVTIDGPAGAGKSTAARNLAEKLGIPYLDTGATYRAVTLKALRCGASLRDEQALARLAREMQLDLEPGPDGVRVILDGHDVTKDIRLAEVTENVHYVASSPAAREVLVGLQRRIGSRLGDFVAEGRDQGSVVFPDADVKFYLDAKPHVRAARRHKEMIERGERAEAHEVLDAVTRRDLRDRNRDVAPLVRAEGAIEIDTTCKTLQQVAEELHRHVERIR